MSILKNLFGGGRGSADTQFPYDPMSSEGLAARWVRWAASIDRGIHPVQDTTGAQAALDQPGDVWFLAGTFGGTVQRRCTVPLGRPLFFPAFNMWHRNASGPPPALPLAVGELTVDGAPVALDTISTPKPFEVIGSARNPVTVSDRPVAMAVWGLWKRLDSLPAGEHEIRFCGGDGYGFRVGATYHLTMA